MSATRMTRWFLFVFLLLPSVAVRSGQIVVRQPVSSPDLASRWSWAGEEAARRGAARYWVGYSITKMMPENSFIGSFSSDQRRNRPALREVIAGSALEEIAAAGRGARRVPKEIAILFSMERRDGRAGAAHEVRISNLALHVELNEMPLFWLEGARDTESIALLASQFSSSGAASVKEEIVQAAGMHEESAFALPFLADILAGREPFELRSEAASALGSIRTRASLALLVDAVRHDRSREVRDQAVCAIARMDSAFGLEAVIEFARDRRLDRGVRARAVFWLGQIASAKAVSALSEITERDGDAEVQRQALYSLAQTGNEGFDAVIEVAKGGGSTKLRREAIYLLGQSEDPRALETLLAIIRE